MGLLIAHIQLVHNEHGQNKIMQNNNYARKELFSVYVICIQLFFAQDLEFQDANNFYDVALSIPPHPRKIKMIPMKLFHSKGSAYMFPLITFTSQSNTLQQTNK